MSANEAISNIRAIVRDPNTVSVHWQTRDTRYHFFLYNGTTDYKDQILFKNSLVPRGMTGHYETRHLNGTKAVNAKMIAKVMVIIHRGDMINNAKTEHRIRWEAEQARLAADNEALEARRLRAREIFKSMRMIMSGQALYYTLIRDDMDALLSYAPSDSE